MPEKGEHFGGIVASQTTVRCYGIAGTVTLPPYGGYFVAGAPNHNYFDAYFGFAIPEKGKKVGLEEPLFEAGIFKYGNDPYNIWVLFVNNARRQRDIATYYCPTFHMKLAFDPEDIAMVGKQEKKHRYRVKFIVEAVDVAGNCAYIGDSDMRTPPLSTALMQNDAGGIYARAAVGQDDGDHTLYYEKLLISHIKICRHVKDLGNEATWSDLSGNGTWYEKRAPGEPPQHDASPPVDPVAGHCYANLAKFKKKAWHPPMAVVNPAVRRWTAPYAQTKRLILPNTPSSVLAANAQSKAFRKMRKKGMYPPTYR